MLGAVIKQPADQLDYDIDFSRWLPEDDEILTVTTAVDPALDGELTVASVHVQSPWVKVWVNGGINGNSYKVSVTAATRGGRIKEVDFKVRVRDC